MAQPKGLRALHKCTNLPFLYSETKNEKATYQSILPLARRRNTREDNVAKAWSQYYRENGAQSRKTVGVALGTCGVMRLVRGRSIGRKATYREWGGKSAQKVQEDEEERVSWGNVLSALLFHSLSQVRVCRHHLLLLLLLPVDVLCGPDSRHLSLAAYLAGVARYLLCRFYHIFCRTVERALAALHEICKQKNNNANEFIVPLISP